MPTSITEGRKFDARPDRVDYRDRPYNPLLKSLPEQFPEQEVIDRHLVDYTKVHKLILNQGQEGACTGFGLAAVVNYLLWKNHLGGDSESGDDCSQLKTVSPRMLYHMARIYDEWPGEDYDGSSCRGAMKGWHRHGVCNALLWPYSTRKFIPPKKGWQQEAAQRPLGAYYRINKDSIADMQAAIYEVGAIYASALVHKGWFLGAEATLPVIPVHAEPAGGHAFAITGYTPQGFIIQNSWGPKWGYHGFAIISYADWVQSGSDAWVAVLGAPIQAAWSWHAEQTKPSYAYNKAAAQPLSESEAYEHTLVMGNNGQPINAFLDIETAADAVKEVALTLPLAWLKKQQTPKLAIYAHGGLNDEEASIKRIRVMAPYFRENEIYPLFLTWRTGFGESVAGILGDSIEKFFEPSEALPSYGWIADIKNRLKEARDRSIEVACEQLLVKPIWMQMKQNAEAGADRGAGLYLLANQLTALKKQIPKLEIHLIGHSAGSILLGHLLKRLGQKKLPIETISLFAPACTVPLACDYYRPEVEKKQIVKREQIYLDILSNQRERADSVGPYGKSLLYLVSRALEDYHKMPLLGMEAAWEPEVEKRKKRDLWNERGHAKVDEWQKFAKGFVNVKVHGDDPPKSTVSDGRSQIPLAHGSFDNDVEVISTTLERIRQKKLKVAVENLHGF